MKFRIALRLMFALSACLFGGMASAATFFDEGARLDELYNDIRVTAPNLGTLSSDFVYVGYTEGSNDADWIRFTAGMNATLTISQKESSNTEVYYDTNLSNDPLATPYKNGKMSVTKGTTYYFLIKNYKLYQTGETYSWLFSFSTSPDPTTTYAVTYKPGDYSSGSVYTATKTKGTALTLRGSTYSRSGYAQAGWSTLPAGTSRSYSLSASYTTDAAVTLYPYWQKNADTVTLSKTSDLGHDYRKFTGSFTVTASSSWTLTQSVTESWLHVSKSGNTVSYTFDQNNTSVYRGCKFTVTCGSASASCQVNQAGRTVDVVWNANGGTILGESTTTSSGLSIGTILSRSAYIPLWTGHTFDGWYTAKTGGTKVGDDTTIKSLVTDSQTTLTLYAHWIDPTRYVSVIWDANGGQFEGGATTSSKSYDASATFGTLPSPTRSGYTLAGWYTQQSGGTRIYATTAVSSVVSSTATSARFYAHWTANGKPNLTFVRYGNASSWPRAVFLSTSGTSASETTTFDAGSAIYLYNCFMNNGAVATGGDFTIRHEVLDGTANIVAANVTNQPEVESNGSRWFNGMAISALQGLAAGSYTYRCTLDSKGVIGESNEDDNVATFAFTVRGADGALVCGSGKTDFGEQAMPFVVSGTYDGGSGVRSFTFVPNTSSTQSVWLDSECSDQSELSPTTYLEAKLTGGGISVTLSKTDVARVAFVKGTVYTVTFSTGHYNSTNGECRSPFKMQIGGAAPTIPFVATPTGVRVAVSGSTAVISWNPVEGATKYHIYVRAVAGDPDASTKVGGVRYGHLEAEVPAGTTTYTDGVSGDTTYWYCVRAENATALSDFSDSVMVEVADVTASQPVVLIRGWTWVSVPVTPTDASFASVFAGVSFADEDVIKSSDGSATYYSGTWYPSPVSFRLVAGRAYAVKKSTAGSATVTVSGSAAPTSLAVAAGWNWIGPTATEAVPLADLKHSAGFADEDVINSSSGSATYYDGTWYGDLKALEPGVGYKAKFGKAGTLTVGK